MQTFKKEERLSSKVLINKLFEKGESIYLNPIKLVWISAPEIDSTYPLQIAVSVSKKYFKNASHRNKIKRRMREAYRKNKFITYERFNSGKQKFACIFIYTSNKQLAFQEIETKIIQLLKKFNELNE